MSETKTSSIATMIVFADILPNHHLAINSPWNYSSQLFITGYRSDSIAVFAMHFVLLGYDVVFYYLASPQPPDKEMLAPQRTDWKPLHLNWLIKNVNKLEFVQKDLKMQRVSYR